MKKVFISLAVLLSFFYCSSAQTNVEEFARDNFGAWGLQTGYTGWGFALGAHGDFTFDQFRGRASAELLIDRHPGLGASIAAHYLLELPLKGLNIYPIAGVSMALNGNDHEQAFHLGLDFGAGIEYNFASDWAIFLDGKYDMNLIGERMNYRTYIGFSKFF